MTSKGMSSQAESIACISSGFLVFIISLVVSPLYTAGDQSAYHIAYSIVGGLGMNDHWQDIFAIYNSRISSNEFMHLMVSIIGSGLEIDKNLLMSVFNGILAAYTVRLFLFWGATIWVATGLVLTNYYFFVLYFAAERLKFAFLFLVLSLIYLRKPFYFAANTFISIFSHFSILFIYCGIFLSSYSKKIAKEWTLKNPLKLIVLLTITVLFFILNYEYLFWKINFYFQERSSLSILNLLPILILLALSCIYAKNKLQPILALTPILFGISLIGGYRLNMLGFFVFLFFGIQTQRGQNLGVISVMLYLLFKTIIFMKIIFAQGQGFQ